MELNLDEIPTGIKEDASKWINENKETVINHGFFLINNLDNLLAVFRKHYTILEGSTCKNILLIEFEVKSFLAVIESETDSVNLNPTERTTIKNNCEAILNRINEVRTIQNQRLPHLDKATLNKALNNEFDIDMGAYTNGFNYWSGY